MKEEVRVGIAQWKMHRALKTQLKVAATKIHTNPNDPSDRTLEVSFELREKLNPNKLLGTLRESVPMPPPGERSDTSHDEALGAAHQLALVRLVAVAVNLQDSFPDASVASSVCVVAWDQGAYQRILEAKNPLSPGG